jgi:hypothetical protein
MPSHRISAGNVVAGINRVTRITTYVKKTSRFLNGNSAPEGKLNGIDTAAARETIPLIPVQLTAVTAPQRGIGSLLAIDGKTFRGRYVAGNIQMNRTAITTKATVDL